MQFYFSHLKDSDLTVSTHRSFEKNESSSEKTLDLPPLPQAVP